MNLIYLLCNVVEDRCVFLIVIIMVVGLIRIGQL